MKSIKLLSIVGAVLGLAVGAKAADSYLANWKAGKWEGKVIESVDPSLKGKKVTATTMTAGDWVTVNVVWEGAKGQEKEVWKISPTSLVQTEYDAQGKTKATYTADIRKGGSNNEKVFDVHCADKAAKKCDNNIDPANNWTIGVWDTKWSYVVKGLKDKSDPKSLGERHRFEFQWAPTAAETTPSSDVKGKKQGTADAPVPAADAEAKANAN